MIDLERGWLFVGHESFIPDPGLCRDRAKKWRRAIGPFEPAVGRSR
jgi:hypothetical protein